MAWHKLGTYNVSYPSSRKHYAPEQYQITGSVSATGLDDYDVYYVYASQLHEGSVLQRRGLNFTLTYSNQGVYKKVDLYFADYLYYPDVLASNVSATVSVWGEKATATASLSKTSGFVDPANPGTVTAKVTTSGAYFAAYSVASGTFYYKKSTASSYSSKAFTGTSISLENLFQIGNTYNVYVKEVLDDGSTVTSPTYTYSTEDGTATATPTFPINVNTYGSVKFQWQYSNPKGTKQYAFDIQTSQDRSTWTNVVSHRVSSTTSYTATISTSGSLYWRVRAYNQENTAGSWSAAKSFMNIIPPSAPTFAGVDGTGRITVSWNSTDQIAFQVMIGKYDSGWIYSADQSYFLNEYLPNGNYTIKVRIANIIGLTSGWRSMTYTQNNSSNQPVVTVTMREGYNELNITGPTFSTIYILRNGIPIARVNKGKYKDYFCNGEDTYVVRGVNQDDSFGDTEVSATYTCRKPAVITPKKRITYVNERLDEQPSISSSDTKDVTGVNYLGRAVPFHHVGTINARTWTISCSTPVEVGKVLFYRNFRGDKAWTICSNVQSALNWHGVHEYQFTLEETDYNEAIKYAV